MQLFTEYERTDDAVRCVEKPRIWQGTSPLLWVMAVALAVLGLAALAWWGGSLYVRNGLAVAVLSPALGAIMCAALTAIGLAMFFLLEMRIDGLLGVHQCVLTLDADGFRVRQRKGFRRGKDVIRLPLAEVAGFRVRRNFDEESLHEGSGTWWYELLVKTPDADGEQVWKPRYDWLGYRDAIITLATDLNAVLGKLKNTEPPVFEPQRLFPENHLSEITPLGAAAPPQRKPPEGLEWNVEEEEDGTLVLWRREGWSRMTVDKGLGCLALMGLAGLAGYGATRAYGKTSEWPGSPVWPAFVGMMMFFVLVIVFDRVEVRLGNDGEQEEIFIGPKGVRQRWWRFVTFGKTRPWSKCVDVELTGWGAPEDEKRFQFHGRCGVVIRGENERELLQVNNLTEEEACWLRDEILRISHNASAYQPQA